MERYASRCEICGQELTDASGNRLAVLIDHGINKSPQMRIKMCAYCSSRIMDYIYKIAGERGIGRNGQKTVAADYQASQYSGEEGETGYSAGNGSDGSCRK